VLKGTIILEFEGRSAVRTNIARYEIDVNLPTR
jgi:hypothetical protein